MRPSLPPLGLLLAACSSEPTGGPDLAGLDAPRPDAPRFERSPGLEVRHDTTADRTSARLCVEQTTLDHLNDILTCEAKHIVGAATALLPYECHTQGIGWHAGSAAFVVT